MAGAPRPLTLCFDKKTVLRHSSCRRTVFSRKRMFHVEQLIENAARKRFQAEKDFSLT
ncbi:hypothetical protein HMPREF7215_1189 [Pyramidobacter piscolens W5455]|uniref:Uncharacterized protein n=1 Tax=Pyramidobacter piscolens W5455 TaxID=352165 RepID=A0ABM9ZTQ2_9BACT|nr:hypothetical protein HMPREF7215_1189 [Pyramidobacter piscolens W5455]